MGEQKGYVDAVDPRNSGWARYINCPGPGETANVDIEQEGTQLYVVALRDIIVGEELLWEANEPLAGVLGGKKTSGNNKIRGLLDPRHKQEGKRWSGRHDIPARLQVRQQAKVFAEPLVEMAEEEPAPANDWDGAKVQVGEFVLAYDTAEYQHCLVGEVLEVSEEEDGRALVWVHGVWSNTQREFWEYGWKKGWVSTVTGKVLFSTPKQAAKYKRYERWLNASDILGTFSPGSGRGVVYVPEKEAREGLMRVRDRDRTNEQENDV